MSEAVKAIGDFELDVLAIPFDSVDSDGQWFDANTDIMPEHFNTPVGIYQHGVEQGAKGYAAQPEIIGRTVPGSLTKQADGWHIRMMIDNAGKFAKSIIEAAKQGILAVSSGAVGHLARLDIGGKIVPYEKNKPGRIANWSLAEVSLWEMGNGNMQPANHRAYAIPALKALYESAGIELPFIYNQPEAQHSAADNKTNIKQGVLQMDEKGITQQDVQAQIAAALKAEREANEAAVKAAKDFEAAVEAKAAEKFDALKAEVVKGRRLPDFDGVAPYATKFNDSKYNNYSAADLALAADVLYARGKKVSDAMIKSMALKTITEKPRSDARAEDLQYIKAALPTNLQDENALKSAEVMATGDSGNGAEWVATLYSPEIWRSIRQDGGIVSRIPSKTMPDGYNNEYIPLEDADPTWYTVGETTAKDAVGNPTVSVPDSKMSTGQKQVTLTKKGARTMYSGELVEDSIIPFAAQLREQLALSGQELMEAWVINADSEAGASANVNDIAGTPAATDWFLGGNGFRKLALVTNTANSRSAGGALSIEDYLETLKLMGAAGIAASDLSKVAFIVDPYTHFANMTLPEVKTRDVFSAATIEAGFLKNAYSVPVLPSWQFQKGATGAYALKANTAGKVDLDTNTNNTTGAILCVRFDQWTMRYKRRMTMEVTRFASADSWEIVALARFGMAYRDSEASAITYNVGI